MEDWWFSRFGYGFRALTESEARYLGRAEDSDNIRGRLDEAARGGDGRADAGNPDPDEKGTGLVAIGGKLQQGREPGPKLLRPALRASLRLATGCGWRYCLRLEALEEHGSRAYERTHRSFPRYRER